MRCKAVGGLGYQCEYEGYQGYCAFHDKTSRGLITEVRPGRDPYSDHAAKGLVRAIPLRSTPLGKPAFALDNLRFGEQGQQRRLRTRGNALRSIRQKDWTHIAPLIDTTPLETRTVQSIQAKPISPTPSTSA